MNRTGSAIIRLLLNWGVLTLLVATVLVVRHRAEAQARAPLPPPAVDLSAADARQWQTFPSYRRVVPVLLYHGINSSNRGLSVGQLAFAKQMLALRIAGFHAITLTQYVNFINHNPQGLPSKPILLTFDDGRVDTYRAADRILWKYGFHATMFTFAAWPTTNTGFGLTWGELRNMQQSGTWSVQEHGGQGHEYVTYNAAGDKGGVYAFRQYIRSKTGNGGHLESFPSFLNRATSDILWGARQFATQLPRFLPLAFAVPYANYGQQQTNDPRIPQFMLPWLKRHFSVVFGGDYLARDVSRQYEIKTRFSSAFSYRISMNSRVSLQSLNCRLRDWVARTPIWKEYRCLRKPRQTAHLSGHSLAKDPVASQGMCQLWGTSPPAGTTVVARLRNQDLSEGPEQAVGNLDVRHPNVQAEPLHESSHAAGSSHQLGQGSRMPERGCRKLSKHRNSRISSPGLPGRQNQEVMEGRYVRLFDL